MIIPLRSISSMGVEKKHVSNKWDTTSPTFIHPSGEAMTTRLFPPFNTVEASSRPRLLPTGSKRRRLQLHTRPSPLVIPYSTTSSSHLLSQIQISSPQVSPKTVIPSWNEVFPTTVVTEPVQEMSHVVPAAILRPCHICHRRPHTRVMLNAYADCELCSRRACYICLRECDALTCLYRKPAAVIQTEFDRPRRICSKCAVEGFTETGDEIVWCLDCVKALDKVQAR
jgi:hypothetical protein